MNFAMKASGGGSDVLSFLLAVSRGDVGRSITVRACSFNREKGTFIMSGRVKSSVGESFSDFYGTDALSLAAASGEHNVCAEVFGSSDGFQEHIIARNGSIEMSERREFASMMADDYDSLTDMNREFAASLVVSREELDSAADMNADIRRYGRTYSPDDFVSAAEASERVIRDLAFTKDEWFRSIHEGCPLTRGGFEWQFSI